MKSHIGVCGVFLLEHVQYMKIKDIKPRVYVIDATTSVLIRPQLPLTLTKAGSVTSPFRSSSVKWGDNNNTLLIGLWGRLNEIMYIEHVKEGLAQSEGLGISTISSL